MADGDARVDPDVERVEAERERAREQLPVALRVVSQRDLAREAERVGHPERDADAVERELGKRIGSAPIKNGSATLQDPQAATQRLAPRANQIRASYAGDARYTPGNSNPVTVTINTAGTDRSRR